MPIEVTMPQMGESIFEGTITRWLKKPGDAIEKDEPLFEISTDKVDAEIPSPVSGIVRETRFPEGATIQVNTVVAVIADAAEAAGAPPAAAPPAAEPQQQPSFNPAPKARLAHRWAKKLLPKRRMLQLQPKKGARGMRAIHL